jgi:hypothetical protein
VERHGQNDRQRPGKDIVKNAYEKRIPQGGNKPTGIKKADEISKAHPGRLGDSFSKLKIFECQG